MSDVQDAIEDENLLLESYLDVADDGAFFTHIGLPPDASWGDFRRHYNNDGKPDNDRHANDLLSYPPIAARIEELRSKSKKTR